MLPSIGALRPWAEPEVVSLQRLDMRPPSVAADTIEASRRGDSSRWRQRLDGRWDFRLFDSPDEIPAAAVQRPVTGRGWRRVEVPGNWTLQDVGDHPQYTNVRMPFDGPPPRLPERNPTGVYRRRLTVPASWAGRQVVLHLGGAESTHLVFVNGEFAGYGTDSRLASEYDITSLVRPGANDLAVVVTRWSAHSYVEDQDQWWMAGLHREVHVEARGAVHVHSLVCDAGLDGTTGTLTARATLGGLHPPERGWQVRFTVETLRNRRLAKAQTARIRSRFAVPYVFAGHAATAEFRLPEVTPWSAESPTRYRVVAELLDPHGAVAEVHSQLVGFRTVEVRDRQLLVNGEPVWIFGVNRHDHHPVRGKAVTVDDMRDDLLAMRRHNITAVRCSHYPNDPRFLDLCDEIGMYVVDEANIEGHAYNTSLCNDARYRSAWLARGARMVERDRNHPCVILWSLGNESGYGAIHDALAGWIRHADPSRPLHYEGAVFHDGWVDGGVAATDVVCPMYPTISAIEEYGRSGEGHRPLIMCEYNHAMGNSNGSLADYWDVITTTPGLQGGFIWEWKDHGLLARLPSGKRGFAYGGQFGDEPNDGNFVADGLMSADLRPHPALQEVTWVHRPVTVELAPARRSGRSRLPRVTALVVTNRRSFTDLDDLRAEWDVLVAGAVVASGPLDLGSLAPATAAEVPLPEPVSSAVNAAAADVQLTVRWFQRRATAWAAAGHLVAWDQFELAPAGAVSPQRSVPSSSRPTSAPVGELVRHLDLCLFRAPVDNDGLKLLPDLGEDIGVGAGTLTRWREMGVDRMPASELVEHRHDVETLGDGSQLHTHHVVVALDDLPRIGVTFELPAGFDRLRWYGRGPGENYPDRRRGALLGTWEAGVDDPPYLVPQEFGLRTDCRWFEFVDSTTGETVRLDVLDPDVLHVSATRFTASDLYEAGHQTDLRPRRGLVVHADVAHRGLGTASCGPDVLDRYRIAPGSYRFSYRLSRTGPRAARRRSGR
jgi:beta-galactosidase